MNRPALILALVGVVLGAVAVVLFHFRSGAAWVLSYAACGLFSILALWAALVVALLGRRR